MAFRTNAAPYQRAKRSTLQIMLELSIALAIASFLTCFTFKSAVVSCEIRIKTVFGLLDCFFTSNSVELSV